MPVIHKICGKELVSCADERVKEECLKSEGYLGDYGYCLNCKKVVHHLVGYPFPRFSPKVIIS